MLFYSIKTLFWSQPSVQLTWNTIWPSRMVILQFWVAKAPLRKKIQDKICFQSIFWRIGLPIFAHKHQLSTSVSPLACAKHNWALTRHIHYRSSSHGQQYFLFNNEIRQKLIQHHIFGGVELTKWSFISNYWILEQLTGTVIEENDVYRSFKVIFQSLGYLKLSYCTDAWLQLQHFSGCITCFLVSAVTLRLFFV